MPDKIIYLLCGIFLFLPLLSGCWDSMDIEKRATVLAIAIDKADPNTSYEKKITHLDDNKHVDKGLIRLTAQIAVPGRIPLGPQSGEGEQQPVWVLSVVGATLDAAMLNLQQELADDIFLGHLRVIIISEDIAKEGVNRFGDYLRRQSEVRRTAWMAVSKESAAQYMEVAPQLERVPALYLTSMVENTVKLGKFPQDSIGLFWRTHSSKGQDSYLPYLEIKKGSNINLEGLAYFKGDSMKGMLHPLQIGLLMALTKNSEGGYGAFYQVPGTDDQVLIQAIKRDAKVKTSIKNGVPEIRIKVRYKSEVVEVESNKVKIDDPTIIREIEQTYNKDIDDSFRKLITKMQEEQSDIFGFGEYIRAKHPAYWRENVKTKENWRNIYKDVTIHVETKSHIVGIGMKEK